MSVTGKEVGSNCTNCKKVPGTAREILPKVFACLCDICDGQFQADTITTCKSYGAVADTSAAEMYDELKKSLL